MLVELLLPAQHGVGLGRLSVGAGCAVAKGAGGLFAVVRKISEEQLMIRLINVPWFRG